MFSVLGEFGLGGESGGSPLSLLLRRSFSGRGRVRVGGERGVLSANLIIFGNGKIICNSWKYSGS